VIGVTFGNNGDYLTLLLQKVRVNDLQMLGSLDLYR
jgi:hypothetical protein